MALKAQVGRPGLEPGTYGLKVRSSAIELATQDSVITSPTPGQRLLGSTRHPQSSIDHFDADDEISERSANRRLPTGDSTALNGSGAGMIADPRPRSFLCLIT